MLYKQKDTLQLKLLGSVKPKLLNCTVCVGYLCMLVGLVKVFTVTINNPQMNEIEVCPECYLSACQKRDNWFCEPCVRGSTFLNE